MTFKELLEKYEQGTATEAERAQVEQELEKYDAISQHYMKEFMPEEEEQAEKNETEWKRIRKKMKKRNILLVLFILVAVVVVSWGSIAINVENILSKHWYDPQEALISTEGPTDLELALETASELYFPGSRVDDVASERTGVGRYRLSVQRWDYFDGKQEYVYGTVDRNKIALDKGFYQMCSMNIFENGDPVNEGVQTPKEEIMEKVKDLPEYVQSKVYVSFGEDLSMKELADILERHDIFAYWVGVRAGSPEEQIIPLMGFDPTGSGYIRQDVEEKYPYYEISDHSEEDMAQAYEEHFKALLQIAIEENISEKLSLLEFNGVEEHQRILDYVEENGVQTYGFAASLTTAEIAALMEEDAVSGFFIDDLRVALPWK